MESDEELVLSFLGGSERAFETLVERHEASVRRLAFGFVRDWGLAEDVAQESFLRAYRKAPSFRPSGGGSFKRWLYTIAINRAQDELRRIRRKPEHRLDETEPASPSHGEDEAVTREMARRLQQAIGALRPEYRLPLVLKEVEGFTYAEISKILGWPLGTVQIRVHRARLALKDQLARRPGAKGLPP